MAVTPVKMEVADFTEREVLSISYEFDKALDDEGQVTGIARVGKIYVKVKALNDGNPELMQWMIERNLAKDVTFTFNETKTGKQMKQYKVTNGYCVEYHEHYKDADPHYEEIVISCQKIEFAKAVFENAWK